MDKHLSRRGFLDRAVSLGAVGITAAGLCVCVLSGCVQKDQTPSIPAKWLEVKEDRVVIHVEQVSALARVGSAAKFDHPRRAERVVVVHVASGQFVALSALCTHRGKALVYDAKAKQLQCINFGHSRFGLDGNPLEGPARSPLHVYRTLYLAGRLEVFC